MPRAVAVGLCVGLATGSAVAAGAAGGHARDAAATKRCAKNRVALIVSRDGRRMSTRGRGRRVCVRLPRVPSGSRLFDYAWRLLLRPAFAPPNNRQVVKALALLRSRALQRLVVRVERALGNAAAATSQARPPTRAIRPPRAQAARQTQTTTTIVNGVSVQRVTTRPDDDEVGGGATDNGTTKLPGQAVGGSSSESVFAKKCPNAAGQVPGERHYDLATSRTITGSQLPKGVALVVRTETGWDAKFEGHVRDDARLRDFQYSATGFIEWKGHLEHAGKAFQYLPTQVYRMTVSRGGIDPHNPKRTDRDKPNMTLDARGPKGQSSFTPESRESMAGVVSMADEDISEHAATILLEAEQAWYDQTACLKAEFNPASLQLQPGQSVNVDATVRQLFEKVAVPMHLKATERSNCTGSSVAPHDADTAPPAPALFTYTASSQCASNPWRESFAVEGVSKRGRVVGVIEGVIPQRPPPPRRWIGTVDGTSHQTSTAFDVTDSWSAQVTFTLINQGGAFEYQPSGTITYTTSGTINGCSVSGSGTHTLDPPDGLLEITLPPGRTDYNMFGLNELGVNDGQGGHTVTISCPDQPPTTADWRTQKPWIDTGGNKQAPADAQNLSDTHTETTTGEETTWTWNLTAGTG